MQAREGLSLANTSPAVLTQRLQRIFSGSEFLDQLCICPGQYCWLLNVDVFIVSCDGNALDYVVQATHAALNSVVLPRVSVIDGDGGTKILDVSNDPTVHSTLDTSMLPVSIRIASTWSRIPSSLAIRSSHFCTSARRGAR